MFTTNLSVLYNIWTTIQKKRLRQAVELRERNGQRKEKHKAGERKMGQDECSCAVDKIVAAFTTVLTVVRKTEMRIKLT